MSDIGVLHFISNKFTSYKIYIHISSHISVAKYELIQTSLF